MTDEKNILGIFELKQSEIFTTVFSKVNLEGSIFSKNYLGAREEGPAAHAVKGLVEAQVRRDLGQR